MTDAPGSPLPGPPNPNARPVRRADRLILRGYGPLAGLIVLLLLLTMLVPSRPRGDDAAISVGQSVSAPAAAGAPQPGASSGSAPGTGVTGGAPAAAADQALPAAGTPTGPAPAGVATAGAPRPGRADAGKAG